MALYPDDANMQRIRPDKGLRTSEKYRVNTIQMGQGYTKTIVNSRKPYREFTLTYTNLDRVSTNNIRDFYRARLGEFETFTFDLDHITESGLIFVKFSSSIEIQKGELDYNTVTIALREVNG